MTRALTRIAIAVALGVVLALAVPAVWRPLVMMRQVGLPGWRPESDRRCDDPPGTRWRHCYGSFTAGPGSQAEDRVSLDRRTRRVVELERWWLVSDSGTLDRQLDSIARALARHGGAPIECPLPVLSDDRARHVAAWRFQEQDARVVSSRWRSPDARQPTWMVQLSGFPVGYSGCQPWVRTRRLLTPAEMLRALQRWLVEHTD